MLSSVFSTWLSNILLDLMLRLSRFIQALGGELDGWCHRSLQKQSSLDSLALWNSGFTAFYSATSNSGKFVPLGVCTETSCLRLQFPWPRESSTVQKMKPLQQGSDKFNYLINGRNYLSSVFVSKYPWASFGWKQLGIVFSLKSVPRRFQLASCCLISSILEAGTSQL